MSYFLTSVSAVFWLRALTSLETQNVAEVIRVAWEREGWNPEDGVIWVVLLRWDNTWSLNKWRLIRPSWEVAGDVCLHYEFTLFWHTAPQKGCQFNSKEHYSTFTSCNACGSFPRKRSRERSLIVFTTLSNGFKRYSEIAAVCPPLQIFPAGASTFEFRWDHPSLALAEPWCAACKR